MDLTFCKYRNFHLCTKAENAICTTTLDGKICDFYDLNTEEGREKFAVEQPNESRLDKRGV